MTHQEDLKAQADRRQFKRLRVRGSATIESASGAVLQHTKILDVSVSGCYIESMFPIPVGSELILTIAFDDASTAVKVRGSVRTADAGVGMGIQFRDADSEQLAALLQRLDEEAKASDSQP